MWSQPQSSNAVQITPVTSSGRLYLVQPDGAMKIQGQMSHSRQQGKSGCVTPCLKFVLIFVNNVAVKFSIFFFLFQIIIYFSFSFLEVCYVQSL